LGRGNTVGGQDVLSLFSGQTAVSSLSLTESLLTGSAMGVFGPDITTAVSNPLTGEPLTVPAFGIVLQALQANSSTNILSTPNILTMDNEQAKIVVGRNIPFPVSNSFNNNGIPVINFSREDVAITLQVTPQINESNYVTLEVLQEVQEVEDGSSDSAGGPTTSKRSAETTVVVRDNQTIVIGGLMGSTDTEVQTKVPLLGDIPLLGRFFRSSSTVTRKTNLLIFLTPHVIDEPADLEEVYRIKVAQRQEFIRRFYGKSRSEQEEQLEQLLRYSMNHIDEASEFRGPSEDVQRVETISDRSPARDRGRLEAMRPISSDTDTPEDTEPAEDSVPAESPESTGSSTEDPAE
jgi:general secretion pathway protein D